MNLKYPLYGAAAIIVVVLLSAGLLWFVHDGMVSERSEQGAVWRFAPLSEGTRFPLSTHRLYPIAPVVEAKEIEQPDLTTARKIHLERGKHK